MANNVYEALSTQINANREIAKLRSVLSTFPADSPVRKTVEAVLNAYEKKQASECANVGNKKQEVH